MHPERFSDEAHAVFRRSAARQRALGFPVIETPTLLVWGEQDVALTLETTHGTERCVSDFTFRRLPGASHWVEQDAPEAVNRILRGWLGGARG